MTRIRLIVMAALAVFCVSAIAASAASAASKGELVNSSKNELTKKNFTGTSGTTELRGSATIKCTADKATGSISSKTTGEETVTFTGCTALGISCKGGTATNSGEIIVLTAITVRKLDAEHDTLLTAILKAGTKEAGTIEINCSGVITKVKGSFLSTGIGLNALATSYTFEGKGTGKVQEPGAYESSTGEKISDSLESETGGKGFEKSAEIGTETVKFEESVQFI